jgi:REP element-mobilizing transposase RayT
MRVEPYGVGSILHVTKRGARGMEIVRDVADRERFIKLLFYLNDSFYDSNWQKLIAIRSQFDRPSEWPERKPLARILAWTLMPNHLHLLLEEIVEGGISKLIQRVCGSMTAHFNAKYNERGSIFQGAYRSPTISEDMHLRYLVFYIQVKNVLELYPGGLKRALKQFDNAWQWAARYKFSSLPTYLARTDSPITESDMIRALHADTNAFKKEARELLSGHIEHHASDTSLAALAIEPW